MGLFTSCSLSKYCNTCIQKCKPTSSVDSNSIKEVDSSRTKTDTTWFNYHNPEDSLKLADNLSAYIDSLGQCKIKNATGSVESGKIRIKYIVRNDSIFIEADTKAYDLKIAQLNTTIDHYKSYIEKNYHSEQNLVTMKVKVSWFAYWQTWAAMGITAYFIFIGIIRRLGYRLAFRFAWPPISLVKK